MYDRTLEANDQPSPSHHCCDQMRHHVEDGRVGLVYNAKLREYAINYNESVSYLLLTFCPWCSRRLPGSLRDLWFDTLRGRGLEPWNDEVPEEFKTDRWWRERGLGGWE